MSYLVDALRKAEHERHRVAAPDIAALSSRAMPGHRRRLGLAGWVVAALVLCNVLLFGYLFWPRGGTDRQTPVRVRAIAADVDREKSEPAKTAPAALAAASEPPALPAASTRALQEPTPATDRTMPVDTRPVRRREASVATLPRPREVPEVDVHGHLYSGDPAESFILVDGHIYHEGERLPSGVTIVRIDKKGALLNYRGRRFHVDGPG